MALKKQTPNAEQQLVDNTVIDYSQGMFQDGNNRTETNKRAHDAPIYDKAAHTIDPDVTQELDISSGQVDVAESRDGTEASGAFDEDGGPLGGLESELDSMEANGAPVDRTPQMKG